MNYVFQDLKIKYKHDYCGMSCMTVSDKHDQILNTIYDEEAEYIYNSLIGKSRRCFKELKKENQKLFIEVSKSRGCLNRIIEKMENNNYVIVRTENGTITYSKLRLAIFWLTHSNDDFYVTFGFNWVPDSKLQDAARKELNKSINVGVDFAKGESQTVTKIELITPEVFDFNKLELQKFHNSITSELLQKSSRN